MRRTMLSVAVGLISSSVLIPLLHADDREFVPLEYEQFLVFNDFGPPAISPSGNVLYFINDDNVYFLDAGTLSPIRVMPGASSVAGNSITWLTDQLFVLGHQQQELYWFLFPFAPRGAAFRLVDLETGEIESNYNQERYIRVLCDRNASEHYVYATKRQYDRFESIYELRLDRKSQRKMLDSQRRVVSWISDGSCGIRGRVEQPEKDGEYSLLVPTEGVLTAVRRRATGSFQWPDDEHAWRVIRTAPAEAEMNVYGVTGDGSQAWVFETEEERGRILRLIDLSDGSVLQEVVAVSEMQVHHSEIHHFGRGAGVEVDYVEWYGPEPGVSFTDPGLGDIAADVVAAFPDRRVRLISRSSDGNRMIFEVSTSLMPNEYYMFDLEAGAVRYLYGRADEIPALHGASTSRGIAVSEDGFEIPYFVTQRPGLPADPPTVILVDENVFSNPWFDGWSAPRAMLAAAGFRVIEVDPRGTLTYPHAYQQAAVGDIEAIAEDFLTATAAATGGSDRVCVLGTLRGGYLGPLVAAVAGDRIRCAAFPLITRDLLTTQYGNYGLLGGSSAYYEQLGFDEPVETEELPEAWTLQGMAPRMPRNLMLIAPATVHDDEYNWRAWEASLSGILEGEDWVTWLPKTDIPQFMGRREYFDGEQDRTDARMEAVQRFLWENLQD